MSRTPPNAIPQAAAVKGAVLGALGPPQVPLFKGTQYVGNVLGLADTLVELIYELLPSTAIKVRSGQSVGETFGISELSIAKKWVDDYVIGNPHDAPAPSLFWITLFDFVEVRTDNEDDAKNILAMLKEALAFTVAEANGDSAHPVLFEFHLKVIELLLLSFLGKLSLNDVVQVGDFLYRFRTTFAAVLAYSFPELAFAAPLSKAGSDGWSVDVNAVVEVHLPPTAAEFLTWSLTGPGAEIFLHFDQIVLDDATGLALVNQHEDNDGEMRFPFGGSVGDLTLSDVVVNVSVRGELAKAAALPIAPYHRYREAFLTQRSTTPCEPSRNLIDLNLTVGSVDLDLNPTVLTTVAALLLIAEKDAKGDIEDTIESGLEGLDDFGSVGDAVAGALTPFLPDAAALQTHDVYKPFTDEHLSFTYDGLRIEGEGHGIHILNDAPEPVDSDSSGGGGTHNPDPPEDLELPPLDEQDPLPIAGWTSLPTGVLIHADDPGSDVDYPLPMAAGGYSPFGDLVLATDQRPQYLARFNAMSGVPPVQEAAVRLWLDGVPPRAIAWIRGTDVAAKAMKVAGRSVSVRTLASLDRLATSAGRRESFLFATSSRWPSTNSTVTSLLAPLDSLARAVSDVTPSRDLALPLPYALESTLARRKGSSVDPFWVGLSVNVIAVTNALTSLVTSDTLGQSGTVETGAGELPFRVDLQAIQPAIRVDLSGTHDRRPVVTISGLNLHFDEERQPSTYTVTCQVPMEAVKPAPGCLPDDAIGAIVYNRSCVSELTGGGQITDAAYLDQLLYRYFVHLQFIPAEATVTAHNLIAGAPFGSVPIAGRALKPLPTDTDIDDNAHDTVRDLILSRAIRAILAAAFTAPVAFDPYYARSPVIQSYEAKDGWLNVYETHA